LVLETVADALVDTNRSTRLRDREANGDARRPAFADQRIVTDLACIGSIV
jgi:hypothetical protein